MRDGSHRLEESTHDRFTDRGNPFLDRGCQQTLAHPARREAGRTSLVSIDGLSADVEALSSNPFRSAARDARRPRRCSGSSTASVAKRQRRSSDTRRHERMPRGAKPAKGPPRSWRDGACRANPARWGAGRVAKIRNLGHSDRSDRRCSPPPLSVPIHRFSQGNGVPCAERLMMRFDRNFLDSNVPSRQRGGSMKKKKKPWHEDA